MKSFPEIIVNRLTSYGVARSGELTHEATFGDLCLFAFMTIMKCYNGTR